MNRSEVIEHFEISDNTFRKWCRAWDIPTNKSKYDDADIEKLDHCQKAMASKMTWDEYLTSIGKAPKQTVSNALVERYAPGIKKTAGHISDALVVALDLEVVEQFTEKLDKPSKIFGNLLSNFSGISILGDSDSIHYLEGEIIDE